MWACPPSPPSDVLSARVGVSKRSLRAPSCRVPMPFFFLAWPTQKLKMCTRAGASSPCGEPPGCLGQRGHMLILCNGPFVLAEVGNKETTGGTSRLTLRDVIQVPTPTLTVATQGTAGGRSHRQFRGTNAGAACDLFAQPAYAIARAQ